ncbi:MAG: Asp-tRNA(Asn)/Glu-tRNA(Gln) amidotransferase GatCAB subunit A [Bryobacteraceae bacterium]|nr:Asp-tRNA(Asn)/Glu-tRNA(Gln) amidotransferase GatCAB subunit A [Bryobacteraceae bacterium]
MKIREAGNLLRSGERTCFQLVQEALQGAEKDKPLNAFITVTAEQALESARQLDRELQDGRDRGPLHGIPIALKDLFFTRGVRTTNGSRLFENFVPEHDAAVVIKLEQAGAVSIGKLNMHEAAYGITSSNPHYGPVRNPWNPLCVPGGSSGGSGVAVATGTVFCGMGSDTGGSIRNPAAFCGVVGLKPTFGRVSRYGCFPLGLTLDTMGPLTRSVEDAALILNAIAGADSRDESTGSRGEENFEPLPHESLEGVRIGWPQNFYTSRLHDDVAAAFDNVLKVAERLKAPIVPVQVPDPDALNAISRTILMSEASAVMQPYMHRRDEIGEDVRTLLDQGLMLTASDYINAQRVRRKMQNEWRRMFKDIDVLLTPTAPNPAPQIGQKTILLGGQEEDTRLASTRFVRGVNTLGIPALSIPCGLTKEKMPVGLQIIGPAWSEALLLRIGSALETELPAIR